MKRLFFAFILVVVVLAGALHGHYTKSEMTDDITISEAYKNLYPETMHFDPMVDFPF